MVAVVVVHEPGDWFEETIDAFADQDYPNLRFLFLIATTEADASSADHVEAMVTDRLESAFVRRLDGNPGFGVAANEVLRLVEGANGFFLFCHDDVAPDPAAIRVMVEEIYRSNAGIVGPKIVEWDDPGVLISVGLGADRFGEIDEVVEPGEVDQEQHDGVRDVFVLPTACMLVRADLFRDLGGFDPAIDFYGEDRELCWRAHHSGARVVVAPIARVRHRRELESRRPDLRHARIEARNRLRSVATLTGAARLPGRFLELLVLTVAELVVGLFTGRFRQAAASAQAFVGLIPRIPSIISRRKAVASCRQVPEREVLGLQQRGSARLSAFLRSRELVSAPTVGTRRWRESTTAPAIAWIVVLALFVLGSRSFLSGGVREVGEFLAFPESPRDLFSAYRSGWNGNGIGGSLPNPTGWGVLSFLSFGTLFRMGLLHTVFILGLFVVGLIGLWKLATVFPSTRARIGALVVYAASPLVAGAYSVGALDVLIAYAAVPWMVHTLRRAVGLETADPRLAQRDLIDGLVELSWAERLRRTLQFAITVGLATAFEPIMFFVALWIGVLLAIGTLLAFAPWKTGVLYLGVTAAGGTVAALLNLPWITSWSWARIVGPSPIGDPARGIVDLASFQIARVDFAALVFAWFVPVVAAILLARTWRLTWAIRSAALVVGFGALAVFGDQGRLPFASPTAGVLLVPVAVGLAISAAAALAAFDLDVRGESFGWRQPLGIAASCAIVIGVVPGAVSVAPGDWGAASTPIAWQIEAQLPDVPLPDALEEGGDYHVLLLGDARVFPVPGTEYRNGVSFAVMSDDDLDVRSRWASTDEVDEAITIALDQIALGSTQRAGRLLAPLGIRFIVVPLFDGVVSTANDPLEPPFGLVEALDEQLDIASPLSLSTFEYYENTAWLPTYSMLSGSSAEASRTAGNDALVRADLTDASPIFVGADPKASATDTVSAGVVHLAVPFDENWKLEVDGQQVPARRAFGVTTAFDVETGGTATLSYETPGGRSLALAFQFVLWALALFGAASVSIPLARRSGPLVSDETLIRFDPEIDGGFLDPVDAGEAGGALLDPGLDMTGQIARTAAMADDDDDGGDLVDVVADAGELDHLPWGDDPAAGEPLSDIERLDADAGALRDDLFDEHGDDVPVDSDHDEEAGS